MGSAEKTARFRASGDTAVLIVDDERSARIASERYLDHCGYRVSAAATAAEAYACAANDPPDVVVCDWRLEEGDDDGVAVARALQHRHGSAVVLVTAYPLETLRSATNDVDVARYLRKPFSLMVLADAISSLTAKDSGQA